MFDEIEVNKPCLKCGKNIETLQTKATICTLSYFKKGDKVITQGSYIEDGTIEVHGNCESCNYWHDGEAIIKNGRLVEVINLVLGDKIQ